MAGVVLLRTTCIDDASFMTATRSLTSSDTFSMGICLLLALGLLANARTWAICFIARCFSFASSNRSPTSSESIIVFACKVDCFATLLTRFCWAWPVIGIGFTCGFIVTGNWFFTSTETSSLASKLAAGLTIRNRSFTSRDESSGTPNTSRELLSSRPVGFCASVKTL